MKTTMDLDDELFLEAKAVAARRRVTLKSMMEHALRREISAAPYPRSEEVCYTVDEAGVPTLKRPAGVKVSAADVRRIMEDEGI